MARHIEREEEKTPWYKDPTVIAGLVAAAAGGGAYAWARTPGFHSKNKTLAALQRRGAEHGYHRVIDVTPKKLKGDEGLYERLIHSMRPSSDKKGRLDWVNRLKLWLQEGDGAIPVMQRKGEVYRATPQGRSSKPINVNGIVFDRIMDVPGTTKTPAHLIRGGINSEGNKQVLQKMTELGQSKSLEAKLFQKYAPKAIPDTEAGLPAFTGATSQEKLKELKAFLKQRFGGKDYIIKQDAGMASSGSFPRSGGKWRKQLGMYEKHMADPKNLAAYEKAKRTSDLEAATYLRDKKLYEGHVLDQILRSPDKALAQKLIQNPKDEWRVHVFAGHAPEDLISGRFGAKPDFMRDPFGTRRRELSRFAEKTIRKLPKEYRRGTYGFDIMEYEKKNGKRGYKLIETNSSEPATATSHGGRSDFLSHWLNPYVGHDQHAVFTGRETTPVALGMAGGAGLLAGGAAYGTANYLRNKQDDTDEQPARLRG